MKPVGVVHKYTMSGIDVFSVELLTHLKENTKLYLAPQTKPLSAEDIGLLSTDKRFDYIHPQTLLMIVREIEERHGIK